MIFDRIVHDAAPGGHHTNPWIVGRQGVPDYQPDFETLVKLLGVPLVLRADSRTGVPALDVMPEALAPARFMATMINRVLDATPVNFHVEARARRRHPRTV